ncbi:hypothetical protein ACFY89_15540 [Achromobacter spanius]|uniref:hypothetical protein n=1 Tax=Achromobacter spanius TaxID=217203 RepID=UPI0036E39095
MPHIHSLQQIITCTILAGRAIEPVSWSHNSKDAMFRSDDLMTVLALECTLGGRRYGHFDHDAANVTGPHSGGTRKAAVLPTVPKETGNPWPEGIGETQDFVTGEYLSTY